jgi:hypothetical protein
MIHIEQMVNTKWKDRDISLDIKKPSVLSGIRNLLRLQIWHFNTQLLVKPKDNCYEVKEGAFISCILRTVQHKFGVQDTVQELKNKV